MADDILNTLPAVYDPMRGTAPQQAPQQPSGLGAIVQQLAPVLLPLALGAGAAMTTPAGTGRWNAAGRGLLGATEGWALTQPRQPTDREIYYRERLANTKLLGLQMDQRMKAEQTYADTLTDPADRAAYLAARKEDKQKAIDRIEWKHNVEHLKSGALGIDPKYVDLLSTLPPDAGNQTYGKIIHSEWQRDNPKPLQDPLLKERAKRQGEEEHNRRVGQAMIEASDTLAKTDPERAKEMRAQGTALSTGAGMIPGITRETGSEKADTAKTIADHRAELNKARDDAKARYNQAMAAQKAAEARAMQTQKAQDRLLADRAKDEAHAARLEADAAHKAALEAQKETGRETRQGERQRSREQMATEQRKDREHLVRLHEQYKLADRKMRQANVPASEKAKLAQQQSKYRSDAMQKHYDIFVKNRTPQERLTSAPPSMEEWLKTPGGQADAKIVDGDFPKTHGPRTLTSPDGVPHQLLPGYPIPEGWTLKE